MTYQSFNEMRSDVNNLWLTGKYAEAFEILKREAPAFPDRHHDTLYMSMCLNSRMGKVDTAIEYFREAIEDIGHWYGTSQLLETDEDLTAIWDNSEFQRLRAISLARCKEAEAAARPLRLVEVPANTDGPLALVIALHGNTGNAENTFGHWKPVVEDGYLLTALQSTQLSGPNAYVWNDFQKAKDELVDHFAALTAEYNIDTSRVVIGGFSMGGGFALWAALNDIIPIVGYIGVGPFIADPESWQAKIQAKQQTGFRSYMLVGEDDISCLPCSQQIKQLMDAAGLPCEFELREGLAHEIPEDFGISAKRALHYILNKQAV